MLIIHIFPNLSFSFKFLFFALQKILNFLITESLGFWFILPILLPGVDSRLGTCFSYLGCRWVGPYFLFWFCFCAYTSDSLEIIQLYLSGMNKFLSSLEQFFEILNFRKITKRYCQKDWRHNLASEVGQWEPSVGPRSHAHFCLVLPGEGVYMRGPGTWR